MALPWGEIFKIGAQVLGSIAGAKSAFGDQGGGVGGATSAQTQGGQTGLQYQDVGGTEVPDFIYQEVLAQLEDEDQQRQMAEAMSQAQEQGLWSGGIIGLMQGGPLYANEGLEIEDYFPEIEFEPELPTPPTPEEFEQQTAEIDEGLEAERMENILEGLGTFTEIMDLVKTLKPKEQTTTVSARRSVTPLPGGGIGKRQAPYPQPKGSGITPFMFQPAAGGGALGRSMFMQNYMPHGGEMQGPGGPKDDLIPVMASDGEYMLSKAAVDQAGGGNHAKGIARLEQFNRLGNRRYG
jgi:hypothetical protein